MEYFLFVYRKRTIFLCIISYFLRIKNLVTYIHTWWESPVGSLKTHNITYFNSRRHLNLICYTIAFEYIIEQMQSGIWHTQVYECII